MIEAIILTLILHCRCINDIPVFCADDLDTNDCCWFAWSAVGPDRPNLCVAASGLAVDGCQGRPAPGNERPLPPKSWGVREEDVLAMNGSCGSVGRTDRLLGIQGVSKKMSR